MRFLILLFTFVGFSQANSQGVFNDPSHPESQLQQDGRIVSIKLVRGEPLKIYVVGKEEAKLDLNNLKLTVKRLSPYPGESLKVDRRDNYFMTPDLKNSTEIEVTAKVKNKKETFRFKLSNKPN